MRRTDEADRAGTVESIPLTKARAIIGRLVRRVLIDGDQIVLERAGVPVAALVGINEFRKLQALRKGGQTGG
jgi:prevent-host-death family protein